MMKAQSHRNGLMIAGLFLSKFDRKGLSLLGFESFSEAYNALGFALGGKPASVKNYMQEFDPKFPNARHGWHKREMRSHCKRVFDQFGELPIDEFFELLAQLTSRSRSRLPEGMEELETLDEDRLENPSFSQRLITGAAAEGFFKTKFPEIDEFRGQELRDVTRYGCGFDFKVQSPANSKFVAVEVKGMAGESGEVMMTEKEHAVAALLRERYFLCVVRNFSERPGLSLYQDPLHCGLDFTLRELRRITQTWHARIPA